MIRVFSIFCCLITVVAAALPADETTSGRYRELWKNSPFTSPVEQGPRVDVELFDGYALGGVSKFDDGYFVILIDKKTLEKRVVSRPGASGKIHVAGVNWSNQSWLETTVFLTDGKITSTMEFDESLFRRISKADFSPPAPTKPVRPRILKSSR